jgi:CubicO group peptidase (beta-lactamase class C family)
VVFFAFRSKATVEVHPSAFMGVHFAESDSILAGLSAEEKILMAIVMEVGSFSHNDNLLITHVMKGGMISFEDLTPELIDSIQAISERMHFGSPYIYTDFPYSATQSIAHLSSVSLRHLLAADKSLVWEYFDGIVRYFAGYPLAALRIDIRPETPFNSPFRYSVFEKKARLIQVLNSYGLIPSLDAVTPVFMTDSAEISHYSECVENLILSGAGILVYDSLHHITTSPYAEFSGINLVKMDKNLDVKQWLLSNSQMIQLPRRNYSVFVSEVKSLVSSDLHLATMLDAKVLKLLNADLWSEKQRTSKSETVKETNLASNAFEVLNRRILSAGISLLSNRGALLPISTLHIRDLAIISSSNQYKPFYDMAAGYTEISRLKPSKKEIENKSIHSIARSHTTLIWIDKGDGQMAETAAEFIKANPHYENILIVFGENPAEKTFAYFDAVVNSIGKSDYEQEYIAQLLFGGRPAMGKLSFHINDSLTYGFGMTTTATRLGYAMPEECGFDSGILNKIDSLVLDAIAQSAMPGCQIFVASKGKVIYHKAFGYHDYTKRQKLKTTDIFDIASVTKVAATTLACMRTYESGLLDLKASIGNYFADTYIDYSNIKPDTTIHIDTIPLRLVSELKNRKNLYDTLHCCDSLIIVREMVLHTLTPSLNIFKLNAHDLLVHQSGLSPSIPILPYIYLGKPFYKRFFGIDATLPVSITVDSAAVDFSPREDLLISGGILKNDEGVPSYIPIRAIRNFLYTDRFIKDSAELKIAENMYLQSRMADSLWLDIKRIRVYSRSVYQYSDANMVLLKILLDTINGIGLEEYASEFFYRRLGMMRTAFHPLKVFERSEIVPTENDIRWRRQLLHGYVHDPTAALLGGIAGNAGLFSNAHDIGVLFQMFLKGGVYGGNRYLNAATIKLFTARQPENYRGLGFDKASPKGIHAASFPVSGYGHTGFTGCCVWVDPENELVFVFLSNRVHPKSANWKLSR